MNPKTFPVSPSTESTSLNDEELAQVSGGLAPNSLSMLKALRKSKRSAPDSDGKPIGAQAFASSGTATKG